MNIKIALLAVAIFIVACSPPLSGTVFDKQECNDLPRRVDTSGYKYTCGIDFYYVNSYDTYYDRSGYILVVKSCRDDWCYNTEVEVDIDTYREYQVGDRFPK